MIGYGGRLCVTRACKYVSSRRVPLRQIDAPAVSYPWFILHALILDRSKRRCIDTFWQRDNSFHIKICRSRKSDLRKRKSNDPPIRIQKDSFPRHEDTKVGNKLGINSLSKPTHYKPPKSPARARNEHVRGAAARKLSLSPVPTKKAR